MYNSDIMTLKRKFLALIYNNPDIMKALNYTAYDPDNPNESVYDVLFPYIKIDGTVVEAKSYIGLKIDSYSRCKNDAYKNFILTISVICNVDVMKTPYGCTRTDLVCGELVKMLAWNDSVGFELALVDDVEDILPTNPKYYYRTVKFKSITTNSQVNGVKQN